MEMFIRFHTYVTYSIILGFIFGYDISCYNVAKNFLGFVAKKISCFICSFVVYVNTKLADYI